MSVILPNVSPINVTVTGGIGPAIIVDGSATAVIGVIGVNPLKAGENISLTTSSVGITIAAANAPVASVQGMTGTVTLSVADLTAAAEVHTHSTSDVSGFAEAIVANSPVVSIQGMTGTVTLSVADLTAAAAVHTHSTSDISGIESLEQKVASVQGMTGTVTLSVADLTAAAAVHTHATSDVSGLTDAIVANSPVVSVQGMTGTVTLSVADLTAAAAVHTHSTSDIVGYSSSSGQVASVQGMTGTVTLSVADLTAAAAVHTHSTSEVSGLAEAITANSPVASVQGQVGTVVLSVADLTAAAAVHTHATSEVSGLAEAIVANSPVASVQGYKGDIVLSLGDLTAAAAVHTHATSDVSGLAEAIAANSVPSQAGNANRVLSTDGTAASWVSRFSVVDPVLVQGGGVTLTRNTTDGSITIAAAGGTSGVSVGSSDPLPLQGSASPGTSGFASREDHVHPLPSLASLTAAAAVHTHSTSDVSGLAEAIVANSPVASVQGQVGTVTLSVADLTAAAAVHTHSTSDIVGYEASSGLVSSVQGQVGTVTLSVVDLTAAAAVHTHSTSDVAGLAEAIVANSPVVSVQGMTGTVTLSVADLTAAAASHSHSASEITDLTSVANVVSIAGLTGAVSVVGDGGVGPYGVVVSTNTQNEVLISYTAPYAPPNVSSLNSLTGQLSLIAGDNVTISTTSSDEITISASGGGGGSTGGIAYSWLSLTATTSIDDFSMGTHTVLRVDPAESGFTITGFANGGDGKHLRIVNPSLNAITLIHESTASVSTNRILIDDGLDRALQENDQAELLYDPFSSRWRVTPCCNVASS
jgi:hypothetical protein